MFFGGKLLNLIYHVWLSGVDSSDWKELGFSYLLIECLWHQCFLQYLKRLSAVHEPRIILSSNTKDKKNWEQILQHNKQFCTMRKRIPLFYELIYGKVYSLLSIFRSIYLYFYQDHYWFVSCISEYLLLYHCKTNDKNDAHLLIYFTMYI